MKVPFFGINRQYIRYRDDLLRIVDRSFSEEHPFSGASISHLEGEVAGLCQRKFAVSTASCTDALCFSLQTQGIGFGDEVLIGGLSFFASVTAILRAGATPVFVDINPLHLMIDLEHAESLVTTRTKAILAVHLHGQTLDMKEIEAFAEKHKLSLIEDAAQAFGAEDLGRPAGSLGAVSCLSFDPSKVIGSLSTGGVFLCDDEASALRAKKLRQYGRALDWSGFEELGHNSRLSSHLAALLSFKLKHIFSWQRERELIALRYLQELSDIPDLQMPYLRPGSTHNWHRFAIRTKPRDDLLRFLEDQGIECWIHYPTALCDESLIKKMNLPDWMLRVPTTRAAVKELLSLPIYPELRPEEITHVISSVSAFFKTKSN